MNSPATQSPPRGYKQTEVGVIPVDWEVITAIELSLRIMVGIVIQPAKYYVNTGVPALRSANIRAKGIVGDDLVYISQEANKLLAKSQLRKNDVLTVRTGYPGTSAVVTHDFISCNCIDLLITRPSEKVNPYYLTYWINSPKGKDQVLKNQGGLAQQHFNVGDMRNLLVALPSKAEQEAIAEALGDADAWIESLEKLIAKKRNLKQAAMQQLLTGQARLPGFEGEWVERRLGEIAEIEMGQSPSSAFYNSKGYGMPLVQGNADIKNRRVIQRIYTTQVTKRGLAGDILMSVRAPVGEVARATFDICLGRGVCAIRFNNNFLYHYLIYLEPSWGMHSKGSTFDSINSTDVRALAIYMPKPDEQTAIAKVLSDMDAEIEALEAKLKKARQIKEGMMAELLTGKTRLVEPKAVPFRYPDVGADAEVRMVAEHE